MLALPSSERRVPSPPRTLLLVLRSYRLIRKSLLALLSFGYSRRSRSLCRLLPAPAASGTFPTLFCESFLRCLSPCPGGPLSAFAWFFLRVIGLPPQRKGRLSRFCPRTRFSTGRVSRLQLFRYVQASQLARLPDRSYRCKYFCRAAKAFTSELNVCRYLHTHRMRYPPDYRQLAVRGLAPRWIRSLVGCSPLLSNFSLNHAPLRADDTGPPWIDLRGPPVLVRTAPAAEVARPARARRWASEGGNYPSEPAKTGGPQKSGFCNV